MRHRYFHSLKKKKKKNSTIKITFKGFTNLSITVLNSVKWPINSRWKKNNNRHIPWWYMYEAERKCVTTACILPLDITVIFCNLQMLNDREWITNGPFEMGLASKRRSSMKSNHHRSQTINAVFTDAFFPANWNDTTSVYRQIRWTSQKVISQAMVFQLIFELSFNLFHHLIMCVPFCLLAVRHPK